MGAQSVERRIGSAEVTGPIPPDAKGYGSPVFFHQDFGKLIGSLAHIFCRPTAFIT